MASTQEEEEQVSFTLPTCMHALYLLGPGDGRCRWDQSHHLCFGFCVQVLEEETSFVRILTLNRPRQLNALSAQMVFNFYHSFNLLIKNFTPFIHIKLIFLLFLLYISIFCPILIIFICFSILSNRFLGYWNFSSATRPIRT